MSVERFLTFLVLSCLICLSCLARAEEPFFKKNDVIALVGGEDMVAASEYGYLELLLTRALPDLHLKFRCLAWEGDTVFEQRRDLNYPALEQQLEQIGATVVIAQFGQMESLAGKEKLSDFVAAYETLIGRINGRGKRRIVLLTPHSFYPAHASDVGMSDTQRLREDPLNTYAGAVSEVAARLNLKPVDATGATHATLRDGVHVSEEGHVFLAARVRNGVTGTPFVPDDGHSDIYREIVAKNRLWFNYYRPQNWAFLAGDRTNQPSSRDHLDPKKRWFPAELEQFLPLIEAKEKEIWELAEKLAKP